MRCNRAGGKGRRVPLGESERAGWGGELRRRDVDGARLEGRGDCGHKHQLAGAWGQNSTQARVAHIKRRRHHAMPHLKNINDVRSVPFSRSPRPANSNGDGCGGPHWTIPPGGVDIHGEGLRMANGAAEPAICPWLSNMSSPWAADILRCKWVATSPRRAGQLYFWSN